MIYFISNSQAIKIGYTEGNVNTRLSALQTGSHEKLRLAGVMIGGLEKEAELHRRFSGSRLVGEWFSITNDLDEFILHNASDVGLYVSQEKYDSLVERYNVLNGKYASLLEKTPEKPIGYPWYLRHDGDFEGCGCEDCVANEKAGGLIPVRVFPFGES